ncbi:hypothetical protein Pint_14499 [Pistacia integerrima]|uniref:Uncharacterized protein n=1 Tax=Pistacia integerrima TaxID=434235 RepID=A0ACC0Y6Y6_9ROSI|nr:hypothetical protein Pint_14499 [Pistacia integerrima]
MTELGHGRIETVTTYDSNTGEFVVNTPCESAQKYCIGGAANHATQMVVFSQLEINGKYQGVHAFICQIKDANGLIMSESPRRICRIQLLMFHLMENILVQSKTQIRFAAFMAALTSGHVNIASTAMDAGNSEKLNELLEINILLLLDWLINSYKECPESCGGQGLKTENHVGHLKSEIDVQSTFEGDNNVLM